MLRALLDVLLGRHQRPGCADETQPTPAEGRPCSRDTPEADLSWFLPPATVSDGAAWDHYWRDQIAHGLGPAICDLFVRDQELLDEMLTRGRGRVLCVGPGISQEPHALAYAGLEVTALDISSAAMDLTRTFPASEDYLQQFFTRPVSRPGGHVEFVVGNLLDAGPCPGPFDAIIERRTLHLYPEVERPLALEALTRRLATDGILVSHYHNGGWMPGEPLTHPAKSWLKSRGFDIRSVGARSKAARGRPIRRSAWRIRKRSNAITRDLQNVSRDRSRVPATL